MKTKQKWEAMSAEERDALIAERLMMWIIPDHCRSKTGKSGSPPDFGLVPGTKNDWLSIPSYTTEVPAAFKVLEKFSDWKIERSERGYGVFIGQNDDFDASLPCAICRCALRAKGIEV